MNIYFAKTLLGWNHPDELVVGCSNPEEFRNNLNLWKVLGHMMTGTSASL